MKPFDLEKAKAGAKVCTRNGLKAEIIRFDMKNPDYPIIALVTNNYGIENCRVYTKDGKYDANLSEHSTDLMMTTTKHKGWINIYPSNIKVTTGYETGLTIYPTKKMAMLAAGSSCIATIPIEWEE